MSNSLIIREEDVSQDIFEAELKMARVRVLLNDLLDDYNFDIEPNEDDIQRLAYNAKKVLTFMMMINDYVFEAEEHLEKAQSKLKDVESEY